MEYIPVVFFTAKGIPGEVEERLDTAAGLVASSMRALGLGECGAAADGFIIIALHVPTWV
jgi:hypothetical protein